MNCTKNCICGVCTYNRASKDIKEGLTEMIQAKIDRNDNPALLAGLVYALTVINNNNLTN